MAVIRWLFLLFLIAGCTGAEQTHAPDGPDSDGSTNDGGLPFGAPCQTVSDTSTECSTGACHHFDMFTSPGLCTLKCTMDTQCPAGSMGPKCNTQGYCRP
jgi:hypothetical protein